MSGPSALQPYRFCVRRARPPFRESLIYCSFLRVCFGGWWLCRRRNDRRKRVLRPPLAEPGEEGEDEQRQPPVGGALAFRNRKVEQASVEGAGYRHREGAADQRPEAAEEEGVRPADVVLELELAAVDPLHHAHDSAGGSGNEGGDGCGPADSQPRGGDAGDDEEDGGDAAEVDELGRAVRRLAVVGLDLVDGDALALQRRGGLRLVLGAPAAVDEAEQVRGAGDDELEADPLPHSRQDGVRAYGELVAAVELGGDVGSVLRRPVGLAVEAEGGWAQAAEALALGQRDGALDMRAPVRADDLAVALLEGRARRVVRGRGRGIGRAGLAGAPPVVVGVDELAEARRVRRGSRLRRNVPHRPDVAQRLDELGHLDPSIRVTTCGLTLGAQREVLKGFRIASVFGVTSEQRSTRLRARATSAGRAAGTTTQKAGAALVEAVGELAEAAVDRVLLTEERVTSAAEGRRRLAGGSDSEELSDKVQRVVMLATPIVRIVARGARLTRLPWAMIASSSVSIGLTVRTGVRELQVLASLVAYRLEQATGA